METNGMGMGDGGLEIIRMVVSLVIVLGMMYAVYYWLKRRGAMPGATQKRLRVIERLPIDARRSILLLQIDGEEFLVGVGGDTIAPLKNLKQGAGDDEA
ncbi:flagellar biosynthetic protein FliO [Pontiellaceae bacterium B1224]|nr:flagellar biosynthetic protein FliO [Pontiellaceae bacterium B1224]